MQFGRDGVFSANKVSTSNNRTNATTFPAGFAFMSKPELRKYYESLLMAYNRLKQDKPVVNESEAEIIRLREKIQVLQRKVSHYQDQYLEAIGEKKSEDNLSAKVLRLAV